MSRTIDSQYTRMMIVEAIGEEQAREVRNLMDAHVSAYSVGEDGFVGSCRLSEDEGRMVILETTWASQAQAIGYHSSRDYRTLYAKVSPLILGDPVVKLFRRYSYTEAHATVER